MDVDNLIKKHKDTPIKSSKSETSSGIKSYMEETLKSKSKKK